MPRRAHCAETDETLTIEPPPAIRMIGIAAFDERQIPLTFTSKQRRHSALLICSIEPAANTPAQLTRISSRSCR